MTVPRKHHLPSLARTIVRDLSALAIALTLLAITGCQGASSPTPPIVATVPAGVTTGSPGVAPSPPAGASAAQRGPWTRLLPAAQAAQPAARRDHTLTVDPDRGLIYLFGGRAGGFDSMDDLWAFDPKTAAWRLLPVNSPKPPARFGHNAFYDAPRKRLLVAVGQVSPTGFYNDVWAFDPDVSIWTQLGAALAERPAPRYGAGGAAVGPGGGFLISHGFTNMGRFDDSWAFDPGTAVWRRVTTSGATPVQRCLTQAFWDPKNGRMLLFGGQANSDPFLGDFWLLDVARGVWTENKAAVLPGPRNLFGAAEDERAGRWYIFGGNTPAGPAADVWSYDLAQDSWGSVDITRVSESPAGRQGSDIAAVGGKLYLFGGNDGKADLADTWVLELGRGG